MKDKSRSVKDGEYIKEASLNEREDGTIESASVSLRKERNDTKKTWEPGSAFGTFIPILILEMCESKATESVTRIRDIRKLAGINIEIKLSFDTPEDLNEALVVTASARSESQDEN